MLDKLVVKLLTLKMWLSDDHGQDLIEYAMLGGLIAVGMMVLAATGILTGAISGMATGIGHCIDFSSSTDCAPF